MSALRQAAKAVLDRWDSPEWGCAPPDLTGDLMEELRAALAEEALQRLTDVQQEIEAVLAQQAEPKNEFNPDWDQMAVLVEQSQEQAVKIDALEKQLAEQATTYIEPTSNSGEGWIFDKEKFADLIRADEREACAKLCDDLIGTRAMAVHCADAIRARGNA